MSEQPITTPTPDETGAFDVVLVDQTRDAISASRAEADARLTEELGEGGRVRRFVKGIWKGTIAKDYYVKKYERQAMEGITDSQDILIHESTSREHRDAAMFATISRFQSDYEEMIHTEAGEQRQDVSAGEIANSLKDLVREYASGNLNDTTLQEERARVLQAYRDQNGDELLGAGKVQIDNLLDVARAVKGAVDHGRSLDEVIEGMRIISAESRAGVRSEIEYTRTDKVIEKLSGSKVGLLLGSEATIAAASIAASVVRFGSTRAVGAAAMTVAPGVGAGLLAGLREKKRVKDDRAQHSREMAQGKQFNTDDKNRVDMDQTRYETVEAQDLTNQLRQHLEAGSLETDDALQAALDQLAAIRAREHLSDSQSIDLIAYSSATSVEQERFDLALARAEVKAALAGRLDDDTRSRLGVDESASINELIETTSAAFIEQYQLDIDSKDAAFRKLRNRRVAKAAATGALVGMTIGLVAQEAGAAMSSTREGLIEQAWAHDTQPHDGRVHESLLQGFASEDGSYQAAGSQSSEATMKFGDHGKIAYSDSMTITEQGKNSLQIKLGNGQVVDARLKADGSIAGTSLQELKEHGVIVDNLSRTVMVETTETKQVGLAEFMRNHQGETTPVTRELWYDNDTSAPVFDQNELGLHWGGESGTGVQANGAIEMSVATMAADGSFHGVESTNWANEARTDNLKLAISPSADTQARPFLLDINPDGTVAIEKDHPAAQFFSIENGQAVFDGKYAEVVELRGENANGVQEVRPLATLVGNDSVGELTDTVTAKEPELRPRYEFIAPPMETSAPDTFVEMAPVIPVAKRRSLESIRSSGDEDTPYYGYGYNMSPSEQRRFRREECSPRLNKDPAARLNPKEELSWRRARIEERQGSEYLAELDAYIDASPELVNLPADTEAIVTIPVAAASEQDNIYKTLQSYGSQDGDLSKTTLLLHVNWFDTPKENKGISQEEQDENIRQTFAEIERAKRDFPGLNIAIMQTQWERQREKDGEYGDGIIGHVARRMYDVAMLSVERQMNAGVLDGDSDVLLIRNDSDAQGIQRTYLEQMRKAMREHPENDVFTGAIRWGTARHRDLPGLGVVSNFREIMHIIASRKDSDTWPPTVGINTAVRMSTFAAVGSVGDNPKRTGIGTDDYNIGGRVKDARQTAPSGGRSGYDTPLGSRTNASATAGYGTRGLVSREDFSYHRHVIGATIDTAPDRLEKAYNNGIPIHNAWENWDTTLRTEGLEGNARDDLRSEEGRDTLVAKIEHDISVAISDRYLNRRQIMAGLAFQFADPRYYKVTQSGRGLQFTFTEAGKKYFLNRMLRDNRGRYDSYGGRVRRALYNETEPGAKKQPLPRRPMMV